MSPDPFTVLSVVLWVAAAPRLRDLGPGAMASRRSVAVAITALAVVTTSFAEVPRRLIDEVSGVPHLQDLVGRSALMVAAVAAQCIFLTLTPAPTPGPRTVGASSPADGTTGPGPLAWVRTVVGRRIIVLLIALALLVAAFVVAVTTLPLAQGPYFLVDQSEEAPLTVYVVTFTSLLGWCFLDLLWAWLRLRHQVSGPLRTGLALLAAGAVAGLGYVLLRLLGMVAEQAPWPSVTPVTGWGCRATGTAAALRVTAGISWHTIDTWLMKAQRWWVARRRLLVLGPLWRDLVAAVPDVALQPPTRWSAITDRFKVTGLPWRVYRRVIEIHDASLVLYRSATASGRSQQTPAATALDAAALAASVARVRDGSDPTDPSAGSARAAAQATLDQEAQIERLVDIAGDHAHRRTTTTRTRPLRDHREDDRS